MPGDRLRSIGPNRRHVYERLTGRLGKASAAAIENAGKAKAGRSAMSRKAARTRARRR